MRLGEKAMTVLRIASMPVTSPQRWAAYEAACAKYSGKARDVRLCDDI